MDLNELITPQDVKARVFLNNVKNLVIENDADNQAACSSLREISIFKKALKTQREDLEKPHKEELNRIKDAFSSPQKFTDEAEALFREKINTYALSRFKNSVLSSKERQNQLENIALKELEALEAKKQDAKKYDDVTKQALIDAINEKQEKLYDVEDDYNLNLSNEFANFKLIWSFDVSDLSKVPAEFLLIDTKKVNEAIKSGVRDIPGLNIFQKPIVSIK